MLGYFSGLLMGLAILSIVIETKVLQRRISLGRIENGAPYFLTWASYTVVGVVAASFSVFTVFVASPDSCWILLGVQFLLTLAALTLAYRDRKNTRYLAVVGRKSETSKTDA